MKLSHLSILNFLSGKEFGLNALDLFSTKYTICWTCSKVFFILYVPLWGIMCFTDTYNSNTSTFYTHSYQLLESMLSQNSSKLNLICVCLYFVVMIGIACTLTLLLWSGLPVPWPCCYDRDCLYPDLVVMIGIACTLTLLLWSGLPVPWPCCYDQDCLFF
jgi:hypothetical protein